MQERYPPRQNSRVECVKAEVEYLLTDVTVEAAALPGGLSPGKPLNGEHTPLSDPSTTKPLTSEQSLEGSGAVLDLIRMSILHFETSLDA